MENSQEDIYTCPSFNSYSSDRLAEIAVEVAAENSNDALQNEEEGEDFEFSLVREDTEVLADEFFYDGKIRSVYPVFNRDLLLNTDGEFSAINENNPSQSSITVSLSKLFIENRENHDVDYPPSCSSSENEDLEDIPAGTYCVWRPKAADQPSPSRCKKSKSTGSVSKRWTFRDLLRRSNSEGKESLVFLTPKNREEKVSIELPKKSKAKGISSSASGGARPGSPSAHEALYVRNRAIREGDKKKSYLPYRQDLVGFFVNVNGLGKGFPHL